MDIGTERWNMKAKRSAFHSKPRGDPTSLKIKRSLLSELFYIKPRGDPPPLKTAYTNLKSHRFGTHVLTLIERTIVNPSYHPSLCPFLLQSTKSFLKTAVCLRPIATLTLAIAVVLLTVACGDSAIDDTTTANPPNSPNNHALRMTIQIAPQLIRQLNLDRPAEITVTIKHRASDEAVANITIPLPSGANGGTAISFTDLPSADYNIFTSLSYTDGTLLGWKKEEVRINTNNQELALAIDPVVQIENMPSLNAPVLAWPATLGADDQSFAYVATDLNQCYRRIMANAIATNVLRDGTNYLAIFYVENTNSGPEIIYRALARINQLADGSRVIRGLAPNEQTNQLLPTNLNPANLNCIDERDTDNDGVNDRHDNCPLVPNRDQANFDNGTGDTLGDACDFDIDGDGRTNAIDVFDYDPNEWADRDNDQIGDNTDNCPTVPNRNQANRYGDPTTGDACEDSDDDDTVDAEDNCPTVSNRDQANFDNGTGDTLGDACDPDIDGDGRNNTLDAFDYDPTEWADQDNDQIGNNTDNCPTVPNRDQTDRYGDPSIGDACEDTDQDGIIDLTDNCPLDANHDQANFDNGTGDTLGDVCDPDIDGDGRNNSADAFDYDPTEWADQDNDQIGNNTDNCPTIPNPNQSNRYGGPDGDACEDTDQDGIIDLTDNCPTTANTDQANFDNGTGDTLGDVCDPDIDGDNRNNTLDAFDYDPTEWADQDNDQIGDNTDNCRTTPNRNQIDRYGNSSMGDACEDTDRDGIVDLSDNCPLVANNDQANLDNATGDTLGDACDPDIDGDDILNLGDNCPYTANRNQTNNDNDGAGDACDDDIDGDGILNLGDNCPLVANNDQANLDNATGDTLGDACDPDIDGDGRNNTLDAFDYDPTEQDDTDNDQIGDRSDNCPTTPNRDQANYDHDRQGDACDDDIDGDGRNNSADAFAYDHTEWDDTDNDTIGDNADNCPTVSNHNQHNLDGDVWGDLCDPDYDNDGIREIRTPAQLDAVRTNLTAAYEVIAHLDLSGYANWQPIGNLSHRFRGTFDGRGHMISNVSGPRALFGSLQAATVHNLRLATSYIPVPTSSHLIGSLAEDVYAGSKISKVHVTLNRPIAVRGTLPFVSRMSGGGLVGYLRASKIVDSQVVINTAHWINISTVTGSSGDIRIGGLVGYSEYSQITNSSVIAKNLSMSTKQHNTYVGGLAGRALFDQFDHSYALIANIEITASYLSYLGGLIGDASGTSITNSYGIVADQIASTTNGYAYVGGLVGNLAYGSRINASYAVVKGSLSSVAPHTYAGGLFGHSGPQINVTASYYRALRASSDSSRTMTNAYGTSRSLSQMRCPTAPGRNCHGALTYSGWDASLWDFGNTSTLPTLSYARDSDGDGLSDLVDNCRFTSNPDQNNADGDPYGDACDAFRDNATEWHNSDADALGDNADNCAFIVNPRQEDYDNDGQGDACDEDIDGDGRTNANDVFDYDPSEQDDIDHDGIGDHADNCPTIVNRDQADLDGDDQGDLCDPDYDNDGIREIRTAAQLDAVRTNLSAAYELIADIDLAHYTSWNPLGAISGGAFTGTFDGRGHRITNLSTSGHQYAGLFGYLWGATIANLNIQATHISANFSVGAAAAGGLAGYVYNSDIRNISVTVKNDLFVATFVFSDSIFAAAGGLVGYILDSSIADASAVLEGNVSTAHRFNTRSYIGGLVGAASYTAISNSYAQVNASLVATTRELPGTRAYAGGLVGWGTHSPISRSHAMVEHHILAESFGNSYGGGLVGYTEYRSHINNTYARIGHIAARSASTAYAGGLAGYITYISNVSNSYVLVDDGISSFEPNNRSYAGGLVGYIDAENAPTNSYYAAQRSPTPDLGTQFTNGYGNERSRRQLECPTGPGQTCQGARTYIGWDAARWLFGDNQTLPELR